MNRSLLYILMAVLVLAGGLGMAGKTTGVTIKSLEFSPGDVTVKAGDTVKWTNEDDRDHAVKSADGTIDSGNISPGKSFSFTFKTVGKFSYTSPYYPRMRGVVTVE